MSTHHNLWRERRAEAESNRCHFLTNVINTNILPLGQTGPRKCTAGQITQYNCIDLVLVHVKATWCPANWKAKQPDEEGVWVGVKLQALVYDILPLTTAVFSHPIVRVRLWGVGGGGTDHYVGSAFFHRVRWVYWPQHGKAEQPQAREWCQFQFAISSYIYIYPVFISTCFVRNLSAHFI